jgi:hypothetical protein
MVSTPTPPEELPMTLADLLRHLMDGEPVGPTALAADVSAGGLHNLLSGKVTEPLPQTLAKLARHFGSSDAERRLLYARMMALSGYFALLPREMLHTFDEVTSSTTVASYGTDDDLLFEEVTAILERAEAQARVRLAMDVLRHFYPGEAESVLESLQAQRDRRPASLEEDH